MIFFRFVFILCFLLIAITTAAQADELQNLLPTAEQKQQIEHAAKQGNAEAQLKIGLLYYAEQDEENMKKGAEWFQKSAEQDNATAQLYLGLLYSRGQGVTLDYKEAANWFYKAALQDNHQAQYSLSVLYAEGLGHEPTPLEAYKWILIATHEDTADRYQYHPTRDRFAKALTLEQRVEAQKLADEWVLENLEN